MDRDFQSVFNTDDPYTMCSGMSFQSLLSINDEKSLLPLLDYVYGTTSFPITNSPVTCGFSGNDFTPIQDNHKLPHHDDQKLKSIDFRAYVKLKMPKHESLSNDFEFNQVSAELLTSQKSHILGLDIRVAASTSYQSCALSKMLFKIRKRVKLLSPASDDPYSLDSILISNFQMSKIFASREVQATNGPGTVRRTSLACQRNQKFSNKTRCLQKVLPCDKKMDMATMLEAA